MAASDPIELDVRTGGPVTLDVAGGVAVEWGASEYIPVIGGDAPLYGGPYEVTPRLAPQGLPTAGTLMARDVAVEGIPNYRTTNVVGGYTVVIAQD